MYLHEISVGKGQLVSLPYKVCYTATTLDGNDSEIIVFLKSVPNSVLQGFMRWIEIYCKDGRAALTGDSFREAGPGVYRFRSGRYRLYCFFDEGSMIVLSHGMIKKDQKTAKKDKEAVSRLRDEYLHAKRTNTLKSKKLNDGVD